MSESFLFSIIITTYNVGGYVSEAIESVISQTLGFGDNVQLILIDRGSEDDSFDVISKYQSTYPDNILVLSNDGGNQANSYNLGLKYVEGKYVNFLNASDKLSNNALKKVNNFFNKEKDIDVVAIAMKYFDEKDKTHRLNFRFEEESEVIDLNFLKYWNHIQVSVASSFIRRDALKDHSFKENIINGFDTFFLSELFMDNSNYGLMGLNENVFYYYRDVSLLNFNMGIPLSEKEYFTDKLRDFSYGLLDYAQNKKGFVPSFIKSVVLYDLNDLVLTAEIHDDLSEDEIKEFWKYFDLILNHIGEDFIVRSRLINHIVKEFLVFYKTNELHIDYTSCNALLYSSNMVLDDLNDDNFLIDNVLVKDDKLVLFGAIATRFYKENISVDIIKETNGFKEVFAAEFLDYPYTRREDTKLLGHVWRYYNNFNFVIPLNKGESSELSFKVKYADEEKSISFNPSKLMFRKFAGMSSFSHYLAKDDYFVIYTNSCLYVSPYKYHKLIRAEVSSFLKILSDFGLSACNILFYRLLYLILFPFMRNKKIWLFNDRPNLADDNGKHLFSHAIKQKDKVKKYYVLDKNSKDFATMKTIDKNIVALSSFKHKILYLFADKIVSPFCNKVYFNPFFENNQFFSGFINSELYFLQHGITISNVSKSINKYSINLSMFLTAADLERESILEGGYNYDDNVVQTLGFPRYDNLNNANSFKQILLMPTWRSYIIDKNSLVNSQYFKNINSFLNNEKLVDFLIEKGYKIAFKPHPEILPYLDLFDINEEVVSISEDDSYQYLFNNSPILVTDRSSVFFDFAYLKKPILYYQPNQESNNYADGYFDFETMGFGDVLDNEKDLVDKIIYYINNGCQMEESYKNRVDTFYKYTDKNNCKRVYEWIYNN